DATPYAAALPHLLSTHTSLICLAHASLSIFLDHVGAFFGYHDSRRVGVAGRHGWHDRGINDAQPSETVHTEAVINHRHRIAAHLASSDEMVGAPSSMTSVFEQFFAILHLRAWKDLEADEFGDFRVLKDPARQLDAGHRAITLRRLR